MYNGIQPNGKGLVIIRTIGAYKTLLLRPEHWIPDYHAVIIYKCFAGIQLGILGCDGCRCDSAVTKPDFTERGVECPLTVIPFDFQIYLKNL